MSEENLQPQATQPEQVEKKLSEPVTKPLSSSDILKKSSEQPKEAPKPEQQQVEIPEKLFSEEDLKTIKDPIARQIAKDVLEKKEKDMLRGMNSKFQEIADIRKQLESKMSESNQWSRDRLEKAMKDPAFVEAVQAIAQSRQASAPPSNYDGTDEEWSALSEQEQNRFKQLEGQVNKLLSVQQQQELRQVDESIKQRLPGYDPKQVDDFAKRMNSDQIGLEELREFAGKSLLFDSAVEQAYQLGLKEGNSSLQDKLNANINVGNIDASASRDIPKREQGVKSKDHFMNIAKRAMASLGASG